jgi:hypothetical protein
MLDSIYLIRYESTWNGSPWVVLDDCTRGMYTGTHPIIHHTFPMSERPTPSVAVLMEIERI